MKCAVFQQLVRRTSLNGHLATRLTCLLVVSEKRRRTCQRDMHVMGGTSPDAPPLQSLTESESDLENIEEGGGGKTLGTWSNRAELPFMHLKNSFTLLS